METAALAPEVGIVLVVLTVTILFFLIEVVRVDVAAVSIMVVLDSQMRVRRVDNLRVCDMSAVPNIIAGGTNAPAIMPCDRCADLVMA